MKQHSSKYLLLPLLALLLSCQQQTDEDKTLASTHPKLEKRLEQDSARSATTTPDENQAVYERYRITTDEYRRDSRYRVTDRYEGKQASLDEASHTDARQFRTVLREGLKQGINFAGRYTVVTVGCGTACQVHYVVDRSNGKVLDKLQGSAGASYSPDSRLFVLNPPDSTLNYAGCHDCAPQAYLFENNRFVRLDERE